MRPMAPLPLQQVPVPTGLGGRGQALHGAVVECRQLQAEEHEVASALGAGLPDPAQKAAGRLVAGVLAVLQLGVEGGPRTRLERSLQGRHHGQELGRSQLPEAAAVAGLEVFGEALRLGQFVL